MRRSPLPSHDTELWEAIGAALGYESRERRNTREPLRGVAKVSTAIELEEQLE